MGDELTHPLVNFKSATVRVSESFHTFNERNYKTTRIFYGINNTMLCTWYNNSHGNITVESRQLYGLSSQTWWRHLMEIISTLLAFCAGNSPVTVEILTQRPETQSYDVLSDLHLNKRLSKQSSGWWFETPSRSLWRHCDETIRLFQPFIQANGKKYQSFA